MFQTTVVNKYLKSVDQQKLEKAWEAFQAHFHNPQIQENIRNSKEEQYQGEFLIDLFVDVLGYTKNPTPGFNLTTELKNTQDSKKADGAIVINDITKAVIELKGTKTTDLTKVQEQAFNYKTSHKGCDVVIISNFEKLRLFIRNQTEFQEFNLFTLDKAQFELLYLLLAYDYFEKNILIKIKDESLSQEEDITKKLYKDYSDFKRELFQDLVKQNPQYDALTLFKSSQKLLDRFLFLFFAEDRGLLPPNAVREILRQWKKLQELDAYDTLINRFRKYFGYLNTGFKGKKYDVFAYNGGLFAPDEVLDHVEISDDILYQYTQQLADYDYQSEVDVNILGHIFENSLNEIEEVRADLADETVDKSKTKRKKDGVFYTPKYITQYIVENTVGKLCEEKKAELDLKDEDYDPGQNYQKKTIAKLEDKLVAYYDWLTALTICDPACGSGAFLNQALDFLIKEHEYLTNLRQNLYVKNGQIAMAFPFSENDILENNLYGVDINEESVEIAKLSLWLRTAKPNRKLNSLSENIKVGNSLIDDPEVAGDKAFVWEKEFAHVFEKGGFDVVIGNPPYVIIFEKSLKKYLEKKYKVFKRNNDLYSAFYSSSLLKLKDNGVLGFITPNSFIKGSYFIELRKFMTQYQIISILNFKNELIFSDANVYSAIAIIRKTKPKNDWKLLSGFNELEGIIKINSQIFKPKNSIQIKLDKLENFEKYFLIKDVGFNYWTVGRGKVRGESIGSRILYEGNQIEEKDIPYVKGSGFTKYSPIIVNNYLKYNHKELLNENDIFRYSPEIMETTPKIIYRQTSSKLIGTIDTEGIYNDKTVHCIINRPEYNFNLYYVLTLFNCNLLNYLYKKSTEESGRAFAQVKTVNIKKLPFLIAPEKIQKELETKAKKIFLLRKELQEVTDKFIRALQRRFEIEKLSKKLEAWHDLTYKDFVKELKKKKVKLSLAEEAEWEDYFTAEKTKADNLKTQISQTDKEIDAMVYALYGLTDEEVAIVEGS